MSLKKLNVVARQVIVVLIVVAVETVVEAVVSAWYSVAACLNGLGLQRVEIWER